MALDGYRVRGLAVAITVAAVVAGGLGPVAAGPAVRLSIATGTTGGVYFPMGGGLASLISKHIPGVTATAEVTPASVDNIRLLQAKRADLAFVLADTAHDAIKGEEAFRGSPVPIRTLAPLYNNFNHLVTVDGTGITIIGDIRGKRVSVGPPGSGTEVTALRILEAAGIHPDRDIRRERLSPAASADAIKDKKMDAFFWSGGLPTAAVLDLAASPGIRIRLVPLDALLPAMQRKWGNLYFRSVVMKEFYPGMPADAPTIGVANLLISHADFDAELAYQITKLLFERRPELAQVHKEAANITLIGAAGRSPLPFHPGAVRYFRERGVEGF
ncbi:MAG: TAXI family TRAP transporter solute-binding subunit [Armatimonadetes bacterium]|nr:TAXI family TRAP transporter solute-binding subunit [Armatimonadota bacterium]